MSGCWGYASTNPMFNCWMPKVCSILRCLAADAVLLQALCSIAGMPNYVVKCSVWLLRQCFHKPYLRLLDGKILRSNAVSGCWGGASTNPMFNCRMAKACGKMQCLAAEAVLLQTLCSMAGLPNYAVKCSVWLLRRCFYKTYVQWLDCQNIW